MDYLQILSPIHNFLHCKTPQAWLDKARDPANLPLLLTDHLVCELKAAQTAMLLVRKYVADKQGSQALLRSEARHYQDYLALAQQVSADDISSRVRFFGEVEAALIISPDDEFRFHSGVPA